MTARRMPTSFETLRESRRVSTVAKMLDADESQVRRLVAAGELEIHRIGRRGIRIYLDSVAAYQARTAQAIKPVGKASVGAPERRKASAAALKSAIAELRQAGVIS